MAEPTVDSGEDTDDETESPDEPDTTDADTDEDVEMVETDVASSGVDPGGFFDGVETDDTGDVGDDVFDGLDDGDDSDDSSSSSSSGSATGSRKHGLAADINAGFSRAAVIGLDDTWETPDGGEKTKEGLRQEFEETFEMFRLGHYGSICAQEYLQMDEDIHPAWGLLGAALICSAVIVYKRPDGDDLLESTKLKLGETNLSGLKSRLTEDDTDSDE